MPRLKQCLFCVLFAGLLTSTASAETLTGKVRTGNSLYHEEKYKEALKKYQEAQVDSPADQRVMFNLGNAQYKLEDYENALSEYRKSAESETPAMRAQSHYNAGNALYRMGKLEESVKQYEKALEYDPDDGDAKFNLEFVRREIRRRMNEQQQRRQEEQKKDQEQEKEDQKQNESGKSQENKPDQNKEQQNAGSDRQKQQEQQKQQENARNEQQEQSPQPEQQRKHEAASEAGQQASQALPDDMMSPDNADRYLQAIETESAEKMKDFLRRQQSKEVVVFPKDW